MIETQNVKAKKLNRTYERKKGEVKKKIFNVINDERKRDIFNIYIYNKIMVFFFSFSFLLLLLHTSIGSFCAYIKLKKKMIKFY